MIWCAQILPIIIIMDNAYNNYIYNVSKWFSKQHNSYYMAIRATSCLLALYTAKNPRGVSGPLHVRYRTFTTS